jgi:hypothetical protein
MKWVRRPQPDLVECVTPKPRGITAEFRHHDPFCPSDDEPVSEAMLARLRTT